MRWSRVEERAAPTYACTAMTGTGSGRRALCVIAVVTTALVSASLADDGRPAPRHHRLRQRPVARRCCPWTADGRDPDPRVPARRSRSLRRHGRRRPRHERRRRLALPDGRKIAFMRTRRGQIFAELWIADSDGANATRLLAPAPAESFTNSDSEPYFGGPKWSPQGDRLAIDVVSTASCGPSSMQCALVHGARPSRRSEDRRRRGERRVVA